MRRDDSSSHLQKSPLAPKIYKIDDPENPYYDKYRELQRRASRGSLLNSSSRKDLSQKFEREYINSSKSKKQEKYLSPSPVRYNVKSPQKIKIEGDTPRQTPYYSSGYSSSKRQQSRDVSPGPYYTNRGREANLSPKPFFQQQQQREYEETTRTPKKMLRKASFNDPTLQIQESENIDQNRPTITNFNNFEQRRKQGIEYEYCTGLGDDDDDEDNSNYYGLKKSSVGLQKVSINSQNEDGTMLTDNEDTNIPLSNADFMFHQPKAKNIIKGLGTKDFEKFKSHLMQEESKDNLTVAESHFNSNFGFESTQNQKYL